MGNPSVRYEFYKSINNLSNKYDINFTNGFRTGLPIRDYYDKLSNSKICLCPNGVSPETFRYTESLGSGCIVITKDKVNSWFYENSTAIFINDWSEVTEEFEEEVEDTIRNPMKSLRSTPDRIVRSVKEVGSFVNKSAKKITNLRKNR